MKIESDVSDASINNLMKKIEERFQGGQVNIGVREQKKLIQAWLYEFDDKETEFIKPGIFESKQHYIDIFKKKYRLVLKGEMTMDALLNEIGAQGVKDIQQYITTNEKVDNSLVNSISYEVVKNG